MAIGFFSVRVGLNDNGTKTSATAHSDYVMGQGKYANKQDEIIHTDCKMPEWAKDEKGNYDPNLFWRIAEQCERKNGNIYREHVISLPRELTTEQNISFVNDWIEKELKGQHYYNYAIHNATAQDGKPQPHLHLMFSDRIIDEHERGAEQFFKRYNAKNPHKGGAKKANTGLKPQEMKQQLKDQRQRFGELLTTHLKSHGHDIEIDMRNWRERGTEPPQNKSFGEIKMLERLNQKLEKDKLNNPSYQAIEREQKAWEQAQADKAQRKAERERKAQARAERQAQAQARAELERAEAERKAEQERQATIAAINAMNEQRQAEQAQALRDQAIRERMQAQQGQPQTAQTAGQEPTAPIKPRPRPKPKPTAQERPQAPSEQADDLQHHAHPKTPQNAIQSDLGHDDENEPTPPPPPRPKM